MLPNKHTPPIGGSYDNKMIDEQIDADVLLNLQSQEQQQDRKIDADLDQIVNSDAKNKNSGSKLKLTLPRISEKLFQQRPVSSLN